MFRRAITFFRKRKAEQELDEELRASVDLLAEEHIRRGLSPVEAARLARIELGGVEQVKEEIRDVRGLPLLDSLMRDFRHALSNLVRAPGFSIAVVATLGVALGANAPLLALPVLLLSAVGCSIGVVAFSYGGRILSTMLFDLTPTDPASLAAGALILSFTALLAGLLPAWRASLVDPARTLRQE